MVMASGIQANANICSKLYRNGVPRYIPHPFFPRYLHYVLNVQKERARREGSLSLKTSIWPPGQRRAFRGGSFA